MCSTATIADPAAFVERIAGRRVIVFADDVTGARVATRTVISARVADRFGAILDLVRELSTSFPGRFLAFADSRRMVEMIVAALPRDAGQAGDDEPPSELSGVLPYRAGYEEADRARIQDALQKGGLRGVVSTSAFELGLDIGEIELVVLLGVPATMKAFWQRVGRAGRRGAGSCLLLDDAGDVETLGGDLAGYLRRDVEPSWLYLDNRYIQYAHALCMAVETRAAAGPRPQGILDGLPPAFRAMLANEIDPTEVVPQDLYPLKQRASGDPHHQFPLRSGLEPTFKVEGPFIALGTLSTPGRCTTTWPGRTGSSPSSRAARWSRRSASRAA